jgi:hypothetical protein
MDPLVTSTEAPRRRPDATTAPAITVRLAAAVGGTATMTSAL